MSTGSEIFSSPSDYREQLIAEHKDRQQRLRRIAIEAKQEQERIAREKRRRPPQIVWEMGRTPKPKPVVPEHLKVAKNIPLSGVTVGRVINRISEHYGVKVIDILSGRRPARVVIARQIGYFIASELTLQSLPQIAKRFGDRDHTTILHGIRKIARLIEVDSLLRETIDFLKADLIAAFPPLDR